MSNHGSALLLRYEQSLDCVHCGLCLPRCPTYEETGDETQSPRGRIYLMRAVSEGRLDLSSGFADAMDNCLVCRACEEVCPSGVKFNRMMEVTRSELATNGLTLGRLKRWCIRTLIPSHRLTNALALLIRVYQRTGLARAARTLRIAPRAHSCLPTLPSRKSSGPLPELIRRDPEQADRGSVVFLEGCVMPALMGDVNKATVQALAGVGFNVHVPKTQTCCGALAAHSGDLPTAEKMARQNTRELMAVMPDHVVVNAAGCGATLSGYAELLKDCNKSNHIASVLSSKTIDVLALLQRKGHKPKGPSTAVKAVYDEPCHLINVGEDSADARRWVESIPNIELIDLPGCRDCCGAAGIYNMTHPIMSDAILSRKLDQLEATGAQLLLTGNIGCLLQWRRGVADRGLNVNVLHPILLAQ